MVIHHEHEFIPGYICFTVVHHVNHTECNSKFCFLLQMWKLAMTMHHFKTSSMISIASKPELSIKRVNLWFDITKQKWLLIKKNSRFSSEDTSYWKIEVSVKPWTVFLHVILFSRHCLLNKNWKFYSHLKSEKVTNSDFLIELVSSYWSTWADEWWLISSGEVALSLLLAIINVTPFSFVRNAKNLIWIHWK